MIKVEQVSKSYNGVKALDALNLHVKPGTIYGLVGANGAGKTTIINHITGVLRQDEGVVTVAGEPVWENSALKQRVLSIADDWFFYNSYTIRDMMKFYKSIYKNFNMERYNHLKEIFSMNEKTQVRRLSKGMKKQVAFWMVLSCMPEVLVLDEPLDGLDPVMRKQILTFLINDVAERGMTVLVSSHNLRELEDTCDCFGIMHKGQMLLEKPLDDLQGTVHKFQLAFSEGLPEELVRKLDVLNDSTLGAVHTLVVRGEAEEIAQTIKQYNPLLCEHAKLTLEEVFIYELGGIGYDVKDIVL